MNRFPRSFFRSSVRIVLALITFILLSTCMEVIDEDLMLLVADKFPPVLQIDSPLFGTAYVSEMTIVGKILDSSETEEDGKGLLASLTLAFLDWGAFNRTILFDQDGNVASMIPDDDFFTYNRETGEFSLTFNTVKSSGDSLKGDQYITLIAEDQNGNIRTWQTTLVDSAFGPTISITSPAQNSGYFADVMVTGSVYDRGSGGASTSEVKSLTYKVGTLAIDTTEVTDLAGNGAFSFTFPTAGFSGNILVEIIATDLNGRTTTERLNLLGDQNGPFIEVT